jgi:hypothetical protein
MIEISSHHKATVDVTGLLEPSIGEDPPDTGTVLLNR